MAKINFVLAFLSLLFFSCHNNNSDSFHENKISISLRLSDGIEYFFPESLIQNLNISYKKDTIELTKAEYEEIINLYYDSNLDEFTGEKAVAGNHNIFPREVDNISIYKNNIKKVSITVLASNLNSYYGNDNSERKIFNFRDKILEILKKKKKFLELSTKTINKYNKLELKDKIVF